jgi:DNA primase
MDWVSFDEIKRTVTLAMVIERYGWQLRKGGVEILRGKCPLPSHSSQESKESFIATLNKGTGGAWSCHSNSCAAARGGRRGGNVLDLVAAVENCSVRDAAIKLQTWFLVPAAGMSRDPAGKEPRAEKSVGKETAEELVSRKNDLVGESETNLPLSFVLQHIDHAHPYLKERGITEETAKKFGGGVFPGKGGMHGRCVFPIHNAKGELVAYAGRSIDGTEPRYKFPAGFHRSQELFNLHRVAGDLSVVLVEGFFDCMKVSQAGYPCVALMGSTMSPTQERLLAERFSDIVVMLDGDEAGRVATQIISDRLRRAVFRVEPVDLPDGVQPDQLSNEEVSTVLKNIVLI